MPQEEEKKILVITTKVDVPLSSREVFIDWQSKLNSTISIFPGFISLEVSPPKKREEEQWLIIQKFSNPDWYRNWTQSKERQLLFEELGKILPGKSVKIEEDESNTNLFTNGVTEVFVTQVSPGMESAYREWGAKINQSEARYPGFQGVYLQAPTSNSHNTWITLLQFDSQEHLDQWLVSEERKNILEEASTFVSSCESHRVISPYAGWFSSLQNQNTLPPVWKQTMVVLLVLFPIVMLERKFLLLESAGFNPSLATFIGNAISVSLIAWPCMPIAIRSLHWWINPKKPQEMGAHLLGTGFVFILYLIEIALFWAWFK